MKIGSFTLIRNEILWIEAHLKSWLPWVDQMVFFDGNSTDGTLKILEDYSKNHPLSHKIILRKDKDPKNLEDDYTRMFDECLHILSTDYAFFLHPDMLLEDAGKIRGIGTHLRYFTHLRSFAGEPGGQLYEIKGRSERWGNIYQLKNPDLGLHYYGHYGAANEDCYFSDITGDSHVHHGDDFDKYPYPVADSGIKILHFSDVRPYERRLSRMVKCLVNQGHDLEAAQKMAAEHPRVTLKSSKGFEFTPAEYPELLKAKVNA